MAGIGTSLWLFLLLNQLPFCSTDADQNLSATEPYSHILDDRNDSSTPAVGLPDTNGTHGNCLIDTEMGLIAIGSAGGMIVCLLVTTIVLACQVCHIQRRVYSPQTSRSNMDLVSGADHWGIDQPEVRGLVGPCDSSFMLEEVRADRKCQDVEMEENRDAVQEARDETGAGLEEGAAGTDFDSETKDYTMLSSRDSCLEVPRDLEDMPLVV